MLPEREYKMELAIIFGALVLHDLNIHSLTFPVAKPLMARDSERDEPALKGD